MRKREATMRFWRANVEGSWSHLTSTVVWPKPWMNLISSTARYLLSPFDSQGTAKTLPVPVSWATKLHMLASSFC